jgi:hypothetical protein
MARRIFDAMNNQLVQVTVLNWLRFVKPFHLCAKKDPERGRFYSEAYPALVNNFAHSAGRQRFALVPGFFHGRRHLGIREEALPALVRIGSTSFDAGQQKF